MKSAFLKKEIEKKWKLMQKCRKRQFLNDTPQKCWCNCILYDHVLRHSRICASIKQQQQIFGTDQNEIEGEE